MLIIVILTINNKYNKLKRKQLGGFSKPLSNDASSSSENDNINHPVSTVMRHRRRAQPMSFKINFEIEVNDDYHCNICGRLISESNLYILILLFL